MGVDVYYKTSDVVKTMTTRFEWFYTSPAADVAYLKFIILWSFRRIIKKKASFLLQIITIDRGIIEMGADVYYNISDVVKTITTVQDLNGSIRALLRNVLMNHIVKYEMDQIESQKYKIVTDVIVSLHNE